MNFLELFKKYRKRMLIESAVKSVILGLIFACTIALVPALIFYFKEYNGILTVLFSCFGVFLATFCLFFFVVFKIDHKKIAKRIDEMGLEQRAITMLDYSADQSFIASKQRENATECIKSKKPSDFRIRILKVPAVIAFALVIAFSATTTMMVANAYVEPPADEQETPVDIDIPWDEVPGNTDIVDKLIDDLEVIIDDSETDEQTKQDLQELLDQLEKDLEDITNLEELLEKLEELKKDIEDTVPPEDMELSDELKEKIDEAMEQLEENSEKNEEESDDPLTEEPGGEEQGDVEDPNGDDKKGEGEEDGENPAPPKPNDEEILESEKIVDGTVPYRELLEEMYKEAMEILASGGTISDELREIIEIYFDIIA